MACKRREVKRCEICGVQLYSHYRNTGRCANHQTTRDPEKQLISDMTAARARGLSYGQYMALKKEG